MMVVKRWLFCASILYFGAANALSEEELLNKTYDYVVVGGGTSGLTVANRLTENGKRSVLVVEYGELNNDPSILIPADTLNFHPDRMYNITTLPIPGLNNRATRAAAGALVGGGSAVNGMFFDRGSAADYDAWEELGNPGWGFDGILPYFKKSVTFTPPSEEVKEKYNYTWDIESAYGERGPIQVSFPPFQYPGMEYVYRAWEELGIPKQKEGAGGKAYDVIQAPSALDPVKRTRSYARTAHYDPFQNRSNYHLLTGYQVTEIQFEEGLTAVGVNVVKRGTTEKIAMTAKREVVVAAGALWTPWLLQRSGIGPKDVLEEAGIDVKKDLPGVGANFQDHPVGGGSWNWTNNTFWPNLGALLSNQTFYEESQREYEANRTGPLTVARGNQAAFLPLKTVNPDGYQDIIDAVLTQDPTPYLPERYEETLLDGFKAQQKITADRMSRTDASTFEYAFGAGPVGGGVLMRPLSRGTVGINTTDPSAIPVVDYQTFTNPIDVQNAIQALRFARRVNSAKAFASLVPVELAPGSNVTSEDALERFVRSVYQPSFAHPSGTASMVPEEYGGVVSPELTVWGTKGLSVVDASVIPFIPATHLCTTVYAVAEKAADLIKERTAWDEQ